MFEHEHSTFDIKDLEFSLPNADGDTVIHTLVETNNFTLCSEYLSVHPSSVGLQNSTGETALHLACKEKTDHTMTTMLIAKGSDVNAVNKWGQSPLHYAALFMSLEKIETLVGCKEIELKTDKNGYNALHCLAFACEEDDAIWRNCVTKLVEAGIDLNQQTAFGQSILHIVCNKLENINLLQYLLRQFKDLQVDILNSDNENFLHSFVMHGLDPQTNDFFDDILEGEFQACSRDMFRDLLNQKDIYGQTPFSLLLDSQEISQKTLKKLVEVGASVNVTDNLGNSALHRVIALSLGNCVNVVKTLIERGASVNASNVHGESVVVFVKNEEVLKCLCDNDANLKVADAWGRTPLMTIFSNENCTSRLLSFLIHCGAITNAKDQGNATALHYAAYHNNINGVNSLLDQNVDTDAVDDTRKTALETARRMNSFDCKNILSKAQPECVETVYTRKKNFRDILSGIPKVVRLSDLERATSIDLRGMLNLTDEAESFLIELLDSNTKKTSNQTAEELKIISSVRDMVNSITKQVAVYDSRFNLSVMPTGSSVEGTKVGPPDEFDFVLSLDSWSDMCDIVQATNATPGFACLKHKASDIEKTFAQFFDGECHFIPYHVLHILFRLIKRALNEPAMWENGNLSYKFEDDLRDYTSKPIFHLKLYWHGLQYKSLLVGIDLVLAIRKQGWWPDWHVPSNISLMNATIQQEGCLLLLQTHMSDDSNLIICGMDDCINYVRDFDIEKGDLITMSSRSMLRISCAPSEICLMKSFPPVVRESYALAKLITKEVCPKITIPMLSEASLFQLSGIHFTNDVDTYVEPNRDFSSYMLKNCVFYTLERLGWMDAGPKCLEHLSVLQITTLIFEHLLRYNNERILPVYFLPYQNIFDFEMTDIQMTEGLDLLSFSLVRKHRREMCIKLILAILRGDKQMSINPVPSLELLASALKHSYSLPTE